MPWIRNTEISWFGISLWISVGFMFALVATIPIWAPPAPSDAVIDESCYLYKSAELIKVDFGYGGNECEEEIIKMYNYGYKRMVTAGIETSTELLMFK